MSARRDINRLRAELKGRLEAYDARQVHLHHQLEALLELGRRGSGSVAEVLGEVIGRIADIRAGMDVNYAAETQALQAVEVALRGIRERVR